MIRVFKGPFLPTLIKTLRRAEIMKVSVCFCTIHGLKKWFPFWWKEDYGFLFLSKHANTGIFLEIHSFQEQTPGGYQKVFAPLLQPSNFENFIENTGSFLQTSGHVNFHFGFWKGPKVNHILALPMVEYKWRLARQEVSLFSGVFEVCS